jgi:hypothetical protein
MKKISDKILINTLNKINHRLDVLEHLIKKNMKDKTLTPKEKLLIKKQKELEKEEEIILKELKKETVLNKWQNDIMIGCHLKVLKNNILICDKNNKLCQFSTCPKRKK